MEIQTASFSASSIATNGINKGFNQLSAISHDIANSLTDNNASTQKATVNYDALNEVPKKTLESNILNMVGTENQIKSLVKVLEVENKLFDDSLGKIFDSWA
ncbi:hypothetical protein [Thiomicrorhabdus lithotrophica]|uniref:Uncharacterized protein n=1 Tax=Thiomicrorhabdus lithotrophica TaxID=2949997 RepID=A0ABY8C9P1_9GAMM|nr:hypothetical protein [Thiomicrorhabdus lithotrophica]WEJ61537.1 hypothetical protein NR989_05845 [Thiomicrorhabdus lithotrophica]